MEHKEGHVIDVTEEYCIHPMSIHVDGVDIVGFHVGQVKATAETTG